MLLAQGVDDSNDFERFASQHNLSFYCEEGWTPLSHGRRDTDTWWEICVVDDSGSWVVVPFLVPRGTIGHLTDAPLLVSFEIGEPVLIRYAGDVFEMDLKHREKSIGFLRFGFVGGEL